MKKMMFNDRFGLTDAVIEKRKTTICIHPSIKLGDSEKCCATCYCWGKPQKTEITERRHRGTTKNGMVFKECQEIGHLARLDCVCEFYKSENN